MRTRCRSSSKPARPYIWRLIVFSRLIWPSTGLVLQGSARAARTAGRSWRRPRTKGASPLAAAAACQPSSARPRQVRARAGEERAAPARGGGVQPAVEPAPVLVPHHAGEGDGHVGGLG